MKRFAKGGIRKVSKTVFVSIMLLNFKLDRRWKQTMADLVSAILCTCSVNSSVLAKVMAGESRRVDSMYRVFNRFVSEPKIKIAPIMSELALPVLNILAARSDPVVFMMDQSRIRDGRECLMISIRYNKRALPFTWLVAETKGGIGFDLQKELLDELCGMLPADMSVLFTADRFYGTRQLIEYCQSKEWGYRIRLKGNLKVHYNGRTIRTSDIRKHHKRGCIENCLLYDGSSVTTSIAVLSDRSKKFKEPWIIAMDGKPSMKKARQYGKRWGIEPMFSDLKSRGYRITTTKLEKTDRIERLILLCAIALYFAISASLKPDSKRPVYTEKKAERSKLSDFTEGTRRILTAALFSATSIPKLWEYLNCMPPG